MVIYKFCNFNFDLFFLILLIFRRPIPNHYTINLRKLTAKNTTKLENSYKTLPFLKNISVTIYRL